jgi:Tol biopolymer transport system component
LAPCEPRSPRAIVRRSLASLVAAFVPLAATESPVADATWIAREATRSRITLIDVDGSSPQIIFDSPHRYAAPDWTPDGAGLIVNGGGKLWRLPISGGSPAPIPLGSAAWIDINHAVSPDGERIAFSSNRGNGLDLFSISAEGGGEHRLTTSTRGDDAPQYSPDGRWINFVSNRAGTRDVWRIPASGAGPGDSKAADHKRRARRCCATPFARWQVALLPVLSGAI